MQNIYNIHNHRDIIFFVLIYGVVSYTILGIKTDNFSAQ